MGSNPRSAVLGLYGFRMSLFFFLRLSNLVCEMRIIQPASQDPCEEDLK